MSAKHTPSEIKLHQKSRLLEISFESGENFKYPCEYLRTHAKSAEMETSDVPVANKSEVNIERIEPQGSYALRLFFSDGYDSGIFSWDTLFDLGSNYDTYWSEYLAALEKHGLQRDGDKKPEDGKIRIKLMYFMTNMLKVTKKETEEIELPESIKDVQSLLKLLRFKGKDWEKMFADDNVQVTVNKQFAELFTRLEHGDEVAFVPKSKDI
ncbi:MAG: gamma-butyrobetaine hydroxylase-like domain-containing protein [Gammaproteobacteria bacterium]|nr:gamma-butyrobetaine hydroxylase-like domain-containing protein [Gammaproteobacteria bacterium]